MDYSNQISNKINGANRISSNAENVITYMEVETNRFCAVDISYHYISTEIKKLNKSFLNSTGLWDQSDGCLIITKTRLEIPSELQKLTFFLRNKRINYVHYSIQVTSSWGLGKNISKHEEQAVGYMSWAIPLMTLGLTPGNMSHHQEQAVGYMSWAIPLMTPGLTPGNMSLSSYRANLDPIACYPLPVRDWTTVKNDTFPA